MSDNRLLGITLYRGRWHLMRGDERCKASWKTHEEAMAFITKLIEARREDRGA